MCKISCIRQAEGSPKVMEMMMCVNHDLAALSAVTQSRSSYGTIVAILAAGGAAISAVWFYVVLRRQRSAESSDYYIAV